MHSALTASDLIGVYSEFYRIRNGDDISLRDMMYLDGVLSVMDSRNFPAIIERETGRKLQDILDECVKQYTAQHSTAAE